MSLIDGGILTDYLHSHQTSSAYTYTYTTTGYSNVIIPIDVYSIYVECWGGGAGGEGSADGGANSFGGDGGGGGGYAASNISVYPGETYSYQIGEGGQRGCNPTPYPGSGGTTFFGINGCDVFTATVRAAGGGNDSAPGTTQTKGGGTSFLSNVGQITYDGGNGSAGSRTVSPYKSGGGGGAAGSSGNGSNGSLSDGSGGIGAGGAGTSEFGGNGGNGYAITNPVYPPNRDYGDGQDGFSYGGGGGGGAAFHTPLGGNIYGGYGAQGLIRITYYI